jgi:hypothetical protein
VRGVVVYGVCRCLIWGGWVGGWVGGRAGGWVGGWAGGWAGGRVDGVGRCLQLAASDLLKGDSVAARATWGQTAMAGGSSRRNGGGGAGGDGGRGGNDTCSSSLAALAGAGATDVSLRVAIVDAELFSLRVACAAQPSYDDDIIM